MKWSQLPNESLPSRYEHASFMSGCKGVSDQQELCVFAGAKLDGPVNDMWKYNFGKGSSVS